MGSMSIANIRNLWRPMAAAVVAAVMGLPTAGAATLTAADCGVNAVQAAINAAAHGDTVTIPNGTCTWDSGLATNKQIKLQGQTKGAVKLFMGSGLSTWDMSMLHFTTGASYSTEISNLQFGNRAGAAGSFIRINGSVSDQPPLIHDNFFSSSGGILKSSAFTVMAVE